MKAFAIGMSLAFALVCGLLFRANIDQKAELNAARAQTAQYELQHKSLQQDNATLLRTCGASEGALSRCESDVKLLHELCDSCED
jgi:hypothetical protein